MKFLYEKVYSNQYFALVLFVTIAVLLVLFCVVLLAAIKDTKKRKLAELDKLEKENINSLQEKVSNLTNDEEVFGAVEAFTEEEPKEPLEFFKNEDEQSKTRDIILSTPTRENSMNNLLTEFEEKKDNESLITENNLNEVNIEPLHKDIVVQQINVPVPEIQPEIKEQIPNKNEIIQENSIIENVIPKVEEIIPIQEDKEEQKVILEDSDDEFELPAIKNVKINNSLSNINLEKSISNSDINNNGIDFGKTGVLNFSSIENETYEIK